MQKFFITLDEFENRVLTKDTSFQLINVLRSKVDDQFLVGVIDKTYLVQINKIENKLVAFEVLKKKLAILNCHFLSLYFKVIQKEIN